MTLFFVGRVERCGPLVTMHDEGSAPRLLVPSRLPDREPLPDYCWGCNSPGAVLLALRLGFELFDDGYPPDKIERALYQLVKRLPPAGWRISADQVLAYVERKVGRRLLVNYLAHLREFEEARAAGREGSL